jgi:hypothetical protein
MGGGISPESAGADALKYATTRQDALRAEFDAWSAVTLSTPAPG